MKGGWIHRIEYLLEGLDLYLNQLKFGFHGHLIIVKRKIRKERTARGWWKVSGVRREAVIRTPTH
jgi:hypothetical protein